MYVAILRMPTELRLKWAYLGYGYGRPRQQLRAYYCYGYGRSTATGTGVVLLRVRAYYDYGYGRTTTEATGRRTTLTFLLRIPYLYWQLLTRLNPLFLLLSLFSLPPLPCIWKLPPDHCLDPAVQEAIDEHQTCWDPQNDGKPEC